MNAEPDTPMDDFPSPPSRLFLHEPGWQIAVKRGNEREFCYMMAPGQDYYHRLLAGEIYLYHGDERICLACADRRGLLSYEPQRLRSHLLPIELDLSDAEPGPGFDLKPRRREEPEH
jgi:hypothetical protein